MRERFYEKKLIMIGREIIQNRRKEIAEIRHADSVIRDIQAREKESCNRKIIMHQFRKVGMRQFWQQECTGGANILS